MAVMKRKNAKGRRNFLIAGDFKLSRNESRSLSFAPSFPPAGSGTLKRKPVPINPVRIPRIKKPEKIKRGAAGLRKITIVILARRTDIFTRIW